MAFRLRLLGRFELSSPDGSNIAVSSKKNQALIAMLAIAGGDPVARSRLTGVLWGDRGEEQARNSLRQAFTALRKIFATHDVFPFAVTDQDAAIDTGAISADTHCLTNPVQNDRIGQNDFGEFLEGLDIPGEAIQHWLLLERQRFAGLYGDRALKQIDGLAEARDFAGMISTANALLGADPLNEAAHRAVMRGYAGQGARANAIRQYQTCSDLLQSELGIEPDPGTQQLYDEIRQSPPAADNNAARPQSGLDLPGIAILPFENLSGDPDQEYFSDGLTEDITIALSRVKSLLVIASSSASTFKGKNLPAPEIAQQLSVRYIVQGSVRRAGNNIRVTAQLVDGETGSQLWAERYDRELEDIFAVQDDIANAVGGTVRGRVDVANARRAVRLSPDNLEAYDLMLQAWAAIISFTKQDNARGIELLERSLALEPDNSTALAHLASAYLLNWMAFWTADRDADIEMAVRSARKAVNLDAANCTTHWVLGEILQMTGEFDEAVYHLKRAVELNPNDIAARNVLGLYYSGICEPELALLEYEEVRRRDPMELNWTPWLRGFAYLTARRYGDAIASLKQVTIPINEIPFLLTVSYAHNGQLDLARDELQTFLNNARKDMAVFPGNQPEDWRDYAMAVSGYKHDEDIDHLIDGLHKAGLGSDNLR